jgi:iron(III) transport system substrate-binding protein
MSWLRTLFYCLLLTALPGCSGCRRAEVVVVYCAHDREFADPIFQRFEEKTGVKVERRYDTEANKSVSLYEDLIREAARPRCDVHWNNEILATLRLHEKGVLQPYESPSAKPFPARYKATDHTWTAFAARARVLLVNTDRVKADEIPQGLWDLTDSRWQGRIAMARPQFGTTATQAACLFQAWGDTKARDFYEKLHRNKVQLPPGNKQVAVGVGAGQFDAGLTDTDDAQEELEAGRPVKMIYPDAKAGEGSKLGVLFIPNTVALIKGCPHPEAGRRLIDFLLRPEVEEELARSPSRQIPLNPEVDLAKLPKIETPQTVRALPVDFARAAAMWKESQEFLVREFALR